MSKTIYVVFGANGFVGSHVVDRLAQDPDIEVRAFDRFTNGPQFSIKPNIQVIKGDIFDDEDTVSVLVGADYVVHSFSATTPFISDRDPYIDIQKNLLRSVQLFEQCVDAEVGKVAFISSGGAIYGTATSPRGAAEDTVPAPMSPYGICKLAIEHYLDYFKHKHGLNYTAYRLSNPYGPRQAFKQNQGVIPAFLGKIERDEPIVIYGDGQSSRDYIYIEDAAKMIVDTFRESTRHTVYNIGSGHQTSLKTIIDSLRDIYHKDFKVEYEEVPKTFAQRTDISMDRFIDEFGAPETTDFATGIKKTLEYRHNS